VDIPEIILIRESELRSVVQLDLQSMATIEEAFTAFASGRASVPSPMNIEIDEHHGEVDVKAAYIRGLDSFAIKIAAGFYNNTTMELPTSSGIMVVVSARTGFPLAVLLDNGYLTQLRTALAGAIAAKYLAPKTVITVGIIGAGVQGRFQLRALRLVRNFTRVLVFDVNPAAAHQFADEMTSELGLNIAAAETASAVVQKSEVVVTSTPSRAPIVTLEAVHEDLHITAMGADGPGKQELDPRILSRADRLVCDRKSQCFSLGEFQHGVKAGIITAESDVVELGEITSGRKIGRCNENDLTVCDLTGVGIQDTAIAVLAYDRAIQSGLGTAVSSRERQASQVQKSHGWSRTLVTD
jgi:ectoine utilization protein EutC